MQHRLPPVVPGPPPYSTLGTIHDHPKRTAEKTPRTRSRSPVIRNEGDRELPPTKKLHNISESSSETENRMDINNHEQFPELTPNHSFLLTNFDDKFRNPKILFQQLIKYFSRNDISRIIPTRNGMLIQSPDQDLATKIRNRHSFEIFGKTANLTKLNNKPVRQPPPPRKSPTLSVVIRGADPILTDEEVETELKHEGHSIIRCIRIKNRTGGATYMIRVLTNNQETIDDLLSNGAYIYRSRYRVEPSHSSPPLPLRCEKCQQYNDHPTAKCKNDTKCGYCSGSHSTRSCTNLQQQPKCTTCNDAHPTFSYKCKARPAAAPDKPELIVPLRTTENNQQPTSTITSIYQPITVDLLLKFITVTLQNLHPFQRQHVLQQIQYAARTTLNVSFNATYSGPYIYCHATTYETEV